eukprot:2417826-Amphidinium_carterae.3
MDGSRKRDNNLCFLRHTGSDYCKSRFCIYLTSHFSGVGTAEAAASVVALACTRHRIDVDLHLHAATDNSTESRHLLKEHEQPVEHIFTDVLDVLPVAALRKLEHMQTQCRHGFAEAMRVQDADRTVCIKMWSKRFLDEAIQAMVMQDGMP